MSRPTRRNGFSVPTEDENIVESFTSSPIRQPSHSPFSTTRPSAYILLIYPVILGLGSLYSSISPAASVSTSSLPLTPGIASDINSPQTSQSLSYFAGKQNVFNLYFVKIGWFWTTLAFLLLQVTAALPANANVLKHSSEQSPGTAVRTTTSSTPTRSVVYRKAFGRYAIVTFSWFLTTQWFFGPALIDRSFISTGGQCSRTLTTSMSSVDLSTITTGAACKSVGGTWHGGHDISGHFFMLVLSSAFLFLEFHISDTHYRSTVPQQQHQEQTPASTTLPTPPSVVLDSTGTALEQGKPATDGSFENLANNTTDSGGSSSSNINSKNKNNNTFSPPTTLRIYTYYFVWLVIVLDIWMLFMTAIWFHTLFEKVSGLVLAAGCVWTIYFFVPEASPAWRAMLGGF